MMRLVEIIADCGHLDTLRGIAEHHEVYDHWSMPAGEDGARCVCRMLVPSEKLQAVIDALQTALEKTEKTRIVIQPVDAVLPRPKNDDDEKAKTVTRTREELYTRIAAGAKLDTNFVLMVVLSTIVAAIGLLEDNVAVVVGAMVIAPLLGPNMSLAFAVSLGDTELSLQSLKTNVIGVSLALAIAFGIGLVWPLNVDSHELMSRTDVGLEGIALALASGMAAVLSLTTGISSALVGVMVAVALLPPTATLGLMLGAGNYRLALGAGLLLAVNIVCVNLAGKIAFFVRGVRPRTWLEKRKARQSLTTYIVFWIIALAVLLLVMHVHHRYLGESVSALLN